MRTSRLGAVLLAIVATIGLLGIPVGPTAPAEVRAATPDLTIVTNAQYEVQPDKRRVLVTVDLTLKNHLKDTRTRRYYFNEAFLAIQPGTSSFKLSRSGSDKGVSVRASKKTKEYTLLRLALGPRLYSGKTAKYRLTFSMKDPGGKATRDLRVGDSLVSFPVWAFASDATPGSAVTVTFPSGYDVKVEAGTIPDPTTDGSGRTVFKTGKLAKPLSFFAYLVGDRPGAYTEAMVATEVLDKPVEVVVRAWPDDEPWSTRVGGLVKEALPVLGERIGLPWPHEEALTVQEAVSRSTGGYAGLFDPSAGLVEIAYYANDFVVLHEAAHGWFNGSLLADRWVNEAFASYYAEQAAKDLDIKANAARLTDELKMSRVPLNEWGTVGSEDPKVEDYAYAASIELAEAIAERAGEDGLRDVWTDAAARVGAYQPASGISEYVEGPPDWRGLLDLLEAHAGTSFDDLWRTWVARPADVALLDARVEARDRYDRLIGGTDGWAVPRPIREAMRAWRFDDATALIDDAEVALAQRGVIERAVAEADLIAPVTLKLAFEDEDGFDDAAAEAAAELEVIARYNAAAAARPVELSPLHVLGLWGDTPQAELDHARDLFARGELEASANASAAAAATWAGAESLGQGRAISLALLALAAVLMVIIAIAAMRRRRRAPVVAAATAQESGATRD